VARLRRLRNFLYKPNTRRGTLINRVRFKVTGMWKVGMDDYDNVYYFYKPYEGNAFRRYVWYAHKVDHDAQKLPFLWHQWLRSKREYPPTEQEMLIHEEWKSDMVRKVAKIKAREAEEDRLLAERIRLRELEEERNEAIEGTPPGALPVPDAEKTRKTTGKSPSIGSTHDHSAMGGDHVFTYEPWGQFKKGFIKETDSSSKESSKKT